MNRVESPLSTTLPGAREAAAPPRVLGWIGLGIYALLAAGVLALLLALSRTPLVQEWLPGSQFFRVALVAHVDLSVLVWFVAGAGILWNMDASRARSVAWDRAAFALALIGTMMISVAPFTGADRPLMNNYVPVLQHPWFYAGLLALGAGLAVQALAFLRAARTGWREAPGADATRFGLALGAACALLALGCIALGYLRMPATASGEFYFDLLFWGGGHVLQFMHTLLMIVALAWLLQAVGGVLPGSPRLHSMLFALAALPLLAVPLLYSYPLDNPAHVVGFTALMRWGGVCAMPLLLLLLAGIARCPPPAAREQLPLRAALLCALTLFCGGGVMGFMIQGSNTVIPAHYHGSIVGVTLAYMGIVYLVLPRLGYPLTLPRAAQWQPYVYGIGQVMHITALAWSGGHGVKRKTVGALQGLDSWPEVIGMGLMGLGGLVAVAGGVMFLVVVIAAVARRAGTPG